MKRAAAILALVFSAPLAFNSCSPEGWVMDYGKPAAQFEEAVVSTRGQPYIGTKVTVRGTVETIDLTDPDEAWLHLSGGTRCHFGKFMTMAGSCKVGDEVYVDGILRECREGDVRLDPAMFRDPTAPFHPKE